VVCGHWCPNRKGKRNDCCNSCVVNLWCGRLSQPNVTSAAAPTDGIQGLAIELRCHALLMNNSQLTHAVLTASAWCWPSTSTNNDCQDSCSGGDACGHDDVAVCARRRVRCDPVRCRRGQLHAGHGSSHQCHLALPLGVPIRGCCALSCPRPVRTIPTSCAYGSVIVNIALCCAHSCAH
jgi:hypothetical protein